MHNFTYQMQLGDKKFNHWLLQYYAWMSCFGVLLFACSFLVAQCWVSGLLQLMTGISLIPVINRRLPHSSSLILYIVRILILFVSLGIVMV